jgi:hypothetical protein
MPDANRNFDGLMLADGVGGNREEHALLEDVTRVRRKTSHLPDQPSIHKDLAAFVYAREIEGKRSAVGGIQKSKPVPRYSRVAFVSLLVPGLAGIKQRPAGVGRVRVFPGGIVPCMKSPRSGQFGHRNAAVFEVDRLSERTARDWPDEGDEQESAQESGSPRGNAPMNAHRHLQ